MGKHAEKIYHREYRCAYYDRCLDRAARTDKPFDCAGCKRLHFKIPRQTDVWEEMITEEAVSCMKLLRAIFDEECRYEHRGERKTVAPEEDVPLADAEWLG